MISSQSLEQVFSRGFPLVFAGFVLRFTVDTCIIVQKLPINRFDQGFAYGGPWRYLP